MKQLSGLSKLKYGLSKLAVWALAPVPCAATVANAKTANPKLYLVLTNH